MRPANFGRNGKKSTRKCRTVTEWLSRGAEDRPIWENVLTGEETKHGDFSSSEGRFPDGAIFRPGAITRRESYTSGICQSISGLPFCRRAALICENGRLPKKPLRADKGDG